MNTLIFIATTIVIFLILHVKNGNNKKLQKAISAFIIAAGISLITPIPDFSDAIALPMFISYNNLQIDNISQLGSHLVNYFIITIIAGVALVFIGLWVSGTPPSKVLTKIRRLFQ